MGNVNTVTAKTVDYLAACVYHNGVSGCLPEGLGNGTIVVSGVPQGSGA